MMLTPVMPFIGALIATYFLSRALARIPMRLAGLVKLLAVHGASLALLMLIVGVVKAYFTPFALRESFVFVVPQLIWLAVDFVRGKAGR